MLQRIFVNFRTRQGVVQENVFNDTVDELWKFFVAILMISVFVEGTLCSPAVAAPDWITFV